MTRVVKSKCGLKGLMINRLLYDVVRNVPQGLVKAKYMLTVHYGPRWSGRLNDGVISVRDSLENFDLLF